MNMTLFPPGNGLPVSIAASWVPSRVGILIGMGLRRTGELFAVVIGENGEVHQLDTTEFTVDWHYDVEKDDWIIRGGVRSDETDQES
jgi:hypothetical protein